MEEFLSYFGNYIRKFRKDKGISQADFAKRVEITPRQLSQIENGKSDCRLGTLGKLMRVVGKENLRDAVLRYPDEYQENFLLLLDKLSSMDPPGREREVVESILTLLEISFSKRK